MHPRNKKPRQALLATALVIGLAITFQAVRQASSQAAATLETQGEIAPISVEVNGQGVNNGYPDLIEDSHGNLWCAWVSARVRDPLLPHDHNNYEESDTILVRKKTAEGWSGPVIVSDYFGVNYQPVLAEDSRGNIIAVWTSRRGGEYALYWRRIGQDLSLGSELKILPAGKLESDPAILSDSQGKLWLAAQSYRRGSMDIVFYAFEGSGWRQMPAAARTPAPEFRPKLAAGRDGSIWAVWDVYENGKYRVKLSRFDTAAKRWDPPRNAPGDGRLDAYAPDVTVDSGGRVWVAYARSSVEEAAYGLRGPKEGRAPLPTIRLVVWDGDSWS